MIRAMQPWRFLQSKSVTDIGLRSSWWFGRKESFSVRSTAKVRRRLSLKDAQDVALTRGGACLSTGYINNITHMLWKCKDGHQWLASFANVSRGSWCPDCAGNKRLSLQNAQDVAIAKGGAVLSTEYVNSKSKLLWRCGKGHEWLDSLRKISRGSWCPYCLGKARLEHAQDIAALRQGLCVSTEYVNCMRHLRWQCKDGHEWLASLSSVKDGGSWCPHCAGNARLTLNDAQDVAAAKGGKCLSTRYVNNKKHLMWRCADGHEWSASLNMIKSRSSWCPECATGSSERKIRSILEYKLFPGKSFKKCRPPFLRSSLGTRLELDGYCPELGIAFEYQGEQHYDPKSYFQRGRQGSFENLIARDKFKAQRCKEVGVQLLVVPCFEKDPESLLRQLLDMPSDARPSQEQPE